MRLKHRDALFKPHTSRYTGAQLEGQAFQDALLRAEGSLLVNSAISSHHNPLVLKILEDKGFSEKAIESMKNCGKLTGFDVLSVCTNPDCQKIHRHETAHRCNRRNCDYCSKTRRRRIWRDYMPYLKQYPALDSHRAKALRFLTISPENYDSLSEGIDHVYENFSKFRRLEYVKNRMDAGIWVMEAKPSKDNKWNVHIHCIYYGRRMDNRLRGKCFECGQNYIKCDMSSGKPSYYCANRKCNSINIMVKKKTKLVELYEKSSGRECHVYITNIKTHGFLLNYMSKYINYVGKADSYEDAVLEAEFVMNTHKRKLINKFGLFFKQKVVKQPVLCRDCDNPVEFVIDREILRAESELIRDSGPPLKNRMITEFEAEQEALNFFDDLYLLEKDLINL